MMICEVLKMETTLLKVVPVQYCPWMICKPERPIFVLVANQAFSAVGLGIRPKSEAVWAVRLREKA